MYRLQFFRTPNGIRTRVAALKGRSPRPLDDGSPVGSATDRASRSSPGSDHQSRTPVETLSKGGHLTPEPAVDLGEARLPSGPRVTVRRSPRRGRRPVPHRTAGGPGTSRRRPGDDARVLTASRKLSGSAGGDEKFSGRPPPGDVNRLPGRGSGQYLVAVLPRCTIRGCAPGRLPVPATPRTGSAERVIPARDGRGQRCTGWFPSSSGARPNISSSSAQSRAS